MKLPTRLVEKPWGRTILPPMFGATGGRRIGEIWFAGPDDAPLLAKYIFTSERLSIQNHPGDEEARTRGFDRGKEECWLILDCEPGAVLGLGLKRQVGKDELRAAALDGSIEQLMDWKSVRAGDFFYVPAGTVHAIGAGISLLEFQQNADVTFRLYDYGRPRDLHLEDGIAVADTRPYCDPRARRVSPEEPAVLVDGPKFSLVQAAAGEAPAGALDGRRRWVMPIEGTVRSNAISAGAGECLLLEPGAPLELGKARALIGAEGAIQNLIRSG